MSPMLTRITLAELKQASERQAKRAAENRKVVGYAIAAMAILWSAIAVVFSYINVIVPCSAC